VAGDNVIVAAGDGRSHSEEYWRTVLTLAITSQNWSRRDPVLTCRTMTSPISTSYEAKTVPVMGALISPHTSTRPTTKTNVLIVRTKEAALTIRQLVVPRRAEL
jgi:hypothetical protein